MTEPRGERRRRDSDIGPGRGRRRRRRGDVCTEPGRRSLFTPNPTPLVKILTHFDPTSSIPHPVSHPVHFTLSPFIHGLNFSEPSSIRHPPRVQHVRPVTVKTQVEPNKTHLRRHEEFQKEYENLGLFTPRLKTKGVVDRNTETRLGQDWSKEVDISPPTRMELLTKIPNLYCIRFRRDPIIVRESVFVVKMFNNNR